MKTHIKLIMPGFARACTMLCIGTITLLTFFSFTLYAAAPPPPPPGHGSGGNVPGGGAPIGGGLLILVALGAGYGVKKVFQMKKWNSLGEEIN